MYLEWSHLALVGQGDVVQHLEMTLKDYLFGRKLKLFSPLSRAEVHLRIDGKVGSNPLGLIAASGFGGWSTSRMIALRARSGKFYNGLAPTFHGKLRDAGTGCEILASYGWSGTMKAFLAVWVGFLFWSSIGARGPGDIAWSLFMASFPFLAALALGPGEEENLQLVLAFLEREVGAKLVE